MEKIMQGMTAGKTEAQSQRQRDLLEALKEIRVADLTYQQWINVGMALRQEGFGPEVWDEWSRNDARYHPGECHRKWRTFRDVGRPITGNTIFRLRSQVCQGGRFSLSQSETDALPCLPDGLPEPVTVCQGGRFSLSHCGSDDTPVAQLRLCQGGRFSLTHCSPDDTPVAQLRLYLTMLFGPEEHVSYVTEARRDIDGKWKPAGAGVCDRTAAQLIAALDRYPEDLGATVGDWKEEAGAWIRFNPVDGKGARDGNVTAYRYALVESDEIPVEDQERICRALELPIAALVHSGGRSLHAIVRVDAKDAEEYRERVEYLYGILEANGMPVDRQNRNPSRLSRLPGALRNGRRQTLLEVGLGKQSFEEWRLCQGGRFSLSQSETEALPCLSDGLPDPVRDACQEGRFSLSHCNSDDTPVEQLELCQGVCQGGRFSLSQSETGALPCLSDGLPDPVTLADYRDAPPELPEELIHGVLRCGHKMLISGSSKAGKSFLLMELCVALAEGTEWLGFRCRQGRVLYVNLEIDPASCINRFLKIYRALGLEPEHMKDIAVWNLRGHAVPLDELVPKLVRRMKGKNYSAVIIDPIYKVITGDENSATDMGAFCNQFDRICTETGCAAIYCHHHSKGAQGMKKAMDRASGSGVFARDPDAQLDMIQLELTEDMENHLRDRHATAWRLECSLREFENFRPVNFWFDYPLHRVDSGGGLRDANAEGSFEAARARNRKYTTQEERKSSIDSAYRACGFEGDVTVAAMAEYLGITERCVRDRLRELKDTYQVSEGTVRRCVNGDGSV